MEQITEIFSDINQTTIIDNPRVNLINKRTNKPRFKTQYYTEQNIDYNGEIKPQKVYFIKVSDKRIDNEPFLISVVYINDMNIFSFIRKENNIEYLNKYWKEIMTAIIKFRQS